MTGTLVDTNVLIDVLFQDPEWETWSTAALLGALARGPVFINQIIAAEVAGGFPTVEAFDDALSDPDLERRDLPWSAAWLAGRVHIDYRRRGGSRTSPMPDFYVGAHAAVEGLDVLTRDPKRITTYFPTVTVISPPSD